MSKRFVMSAALALFAANACAADVKHILRTADDFRIYAQSAKVVTGVELYKDDKLDGERLYHVYVKPGRRSLVLFKTAAESGQKMLMLDDKYWLMLPASKRPLRITATQKLLGEASVGDIATMTWSEDYHGTIVAPEALQGVAALKLDLRSAREGTTYDRIALWVRADNYRRSRQSCISLGQTGQVALRAWRVGGPRGHRAHALAGSHPVNRRTVLQYRSIEETEIPDKLYNPAYLVRENRSRGEPCVARHHSGAAFAAMPPLRPARYSAGLRAAAATTRPIPTALFYLESSRRVGQEEAS